MATNLHSWTGRVESVERATMSGGGVQFIVKGIGHDGHARTFRMSADQTPPAVGDHIQLQAKESRYNSPRTGQPATSYWIQAWKHAEGPPPMAQPAQGWQKPAPAIPDAPTAGRSLPTVKEQIQKECVAAFIRAGKVGPSYEELRAAFDTVGMAWDDHQSRPLMHHDPGDKPITGMESENPGDGLDPDGPIPF